mmetsp:Transcript_10883/g.21277  ORF Transcript_10883/g.21277 Transcript_10883/m.21277 type:complete len:439 (-) Transcript_10883:26-1342(-)
MLSALLKMVKEARVAGLIFASAFVLGVSQSNVYPYLSSMVMDLGMTNSRNSTGYYAGLIGSFMSLGKMISSPLWGYFADTYGRRPSTLLGLAAIVITSILFGFSQSYLWALLVRLSLGIFCPLGIIMRSSAGELSDLNQASAMLLIGLGYNLGTVGGHFLGGFLAKPSYFDLDILHTYPYLLPNLCVSAMAFGLLIVCYFHYEETLHESTVSTESLSLNAYIKLLKDPEVRRMFILQCLNNFCQTSMNELYPLWCWAERSHGGLQFNPIQIGATLSASVIVMVMIQQWLYLFMINSKGTLWVCTLGTLMKVPVLMLIPQIIEFESWTWFGLLLGILAWYLFNSQVVTSHNILSNNSVKAADRAKMNGLSQTMSSACKAMAPACIGSMFAWSLEVSVYPVDYHLSFYFLAMLTVVQFLITLNISPSLDSGKSKLKEALL